MAEMLVTKSFNVALTFCMCAIALHQSAIIIAAEMLLAVCVKLDGDTRRAGRALGGTSGRLAEY